MTDALETAARKHMSFYERDLVWQFVQFGITVTTPLVRENDELKQKLAAQQRVESAIMEEFCKMEERFKKLELENEALRAHAENGRKWIEAWHAAEDRAEVFTGFYDNTTSKLLEERV